MLHPAILAELLDGEVQLARSVLGVRAADLHREGRNLLMTLQRPDGEWWLRLDGSGYDSEPFDVALIDDAGVVLPESSWIPGFGLGLHPVLNTPWVCVSGTRGYYCHPSHFAERWDAARFDLRTDSLLTKLLDKAGL